MTISADQRLQNIVTGLDAHRRATALQLKNAINGKQWDQVPALHGRHEALAHAESHVSRVRGRIESLQQIHELACQLGGNITQSEESLDQALTDHRFSDVASLSGAITGWTLAESVIMEAIA